MILPHKIKPGKENGGDKNNFLNNLNKAFNFLNFITDLLFLDSNNVVYVGFNTLTNSLKKLKITLEVPKLDRGIDFIVS